jgi:hypothetical protein
MGGRHYYDHPPGIVLRGQTVAAKASATMTKIVALKIIVFAFGTFYSQHIGYLLLCESVVVLAVFIDLLHRVLVVCWKEIIII